MNTNPLREQVQGLLDRVKATVAIWLKKQSMEDLETEVIRKLDMHKERIIAQVMGFEPSIWAAGGWTINHSLRSPVITAMKAKAELMAKAWVDQLTTEPIQLSKNCLTYMRSDLVRALRAAVEDGLRQAAEKLAEQYVEEMIKEAKSET